MTSTEAKVVHVVDDEVEVRNSLSVLLKSLNFRPELWSDGKSFLDALTFSSPGCVLLDLHMPGTDGIAVQQRLIPFERSFPVVMISGHGDTTMAARALRAGARDFLSKPFTRIELQNAILDSWNWIYDPAAKLQVRERARCKLEALSERELALLRLFARGEAEKRASILLEMPLDDVDLCREIIFLKLEVGRMARAVRTFYDAA